MKKILFFLAVSIGMMGASVTAFGQAGQCFGGGCAGPGTSWGATQSTTSTTFVNSVAGTWGGEYNTYNVTAGQQYEWSLCTADGAVNLTSDMTMTLKTTANATICYSDDVCGLSPKILWTATFTGQVRVLINVYPCVTNSNSHTVRWRCVSCGSAAYKTQWISMNTGPSDWCAGETRAVSVTIRNAGTQPWTDGGGNDFNVGVKWNADADYFVRVDAQNLAPGATATYTFNVTAPLATGSNNLTFDVVREACYWFANNSTNCGSTAGPGNVTYVSSPLTIKPAPTNPNAGPDVSICGGSSTNLNGSVVVPPNGGNLVLSFRAQSFGDEASWTIERVSDGVVLSSGGPYGNTAQQTITLPAYSVPVRLRVNNSGLFCDNNPIWSLTCNGNSLGGGVATGCTNNIVLNNISCPIPVTYAWSPATGLNNPNISNPTASPSSTTTYTMTATANGCSVSDNVVVTVNPFSPPLGISGSTNLCSSAPVVLSVYGGSLGTGGSIQWFSGSCGSTPIGSGTTITVTPTQTTTYFARYTGTCGTTVCVSVPVSIPAPINPNAGSNVAICAGSSQNLSGTAQGSTIVQNAFTASDAAQFVTFLTNDTNRWSYNPFTNLAGGSPPELQFEWYTGGNGTLVSAWAESPVINTAGFTSLTLTFKHRVDRFDLADIGGTVPLFVQTSPDGVTWTTRWNINPTTDIGPETVAINLDALAGTSFRMRFLFDGNIWNIDLWSIDDIVLSGLRPVAPTFSWTPTASLVNANTAAPTATPAATTMYTMTATVGNCSASSNVTVSVVTPSAGSITPASITACAGTNPGTLTLGGYTGSISRWEVSTTGGAIWTPIVTTSPTYSPTNVTQTSWYRAVVVNGPCTTNSAIAVITVTPASNALATNNQTRTCAVNGSTFVEFRESGTGNLIVSINPQGQNLGNVTATVYDAGAPIPFQACGTYQPWFVTDVLERRWVITAQNQPSSNVTIRLPFANSEVTALQASANSNANPNDDVASASMLDLTKFNNPLNPSVEDGTVANNCTNGATSAVFIQNGFGALAGYTQASYLQYSIPGFSEFWLSGTNNVSPLPIVLQSFTAHCAEAEGRVVIKWITATELNNEYFVIEKSANLMDWETVAMVDGAGNSNEPLMYSVTDDRPLGMTYYRLSQFDYDGQFETFEPISVLCYGNGGSIAVIPNPNSGIFDVRVTLPVHTESIFSVIDVNGKSYPLGTITGTGTEQRYGFDISLFSAGVYTIVVQTSEGTQVVKTVIVK